MTEGLELTEVGNKISEDVDWNGQRVATIGQGIMRVMGLIRGDSEGEEEFSVWPDFSVYFLKVIFRDSFIAKCPVGFWR